MPTPHALLSGLLTYIDQVERLSHKPAYGIPADELLGYQAEIEALPGMALNQPEGAWLRVSRLSKTPPPALPALLVGWTMAWDDPKKAPTLSESAKIPGKDGVPVETAVQDAPGVQALFEAYMRELWKPWASSEIPVRASIKLYQKLFLLHQSISMDASETPLELVWGVGVATWLVSAKKIQHPLISQTCELALNPMDFSIEIRARDTEPGLEIDCYAELQNPGVKGVEESWRERQAQSERSEAALSPFVEESFAPALRSAAAQLSPTGSYSGPTETLSPAGPTLAVSGSWVLFFRKRSGHFLLQDVARLKEAALAAEKAGQDLPSALSAFVTPGRDEVLERVATRYRGVSSGSGVSGAKELYFPLPYNAEQVAIASELESRDGALVQGPPGTGKTHTIANIVCHYLAQGKRVLVTAKGETALSVLKEKLPEQIQRLCVSLLSDDREGMRQFEQSISAIATEVASLNAPEVEAQIRALEEQIEQEHASLAEIDAKAAAFAREHLEQRRFGGESAMLADIAKALSSAPEALWIEHSVFPDASLSFDDSDLALLRQVRAEAGADLVSLRERAPLAASLPSPSEFAALARDLNKKALLQGQLKSGALRQPLERDPAKAGETTAALRSLIERAMEMASALSQLGEGAAWSSGARSAARKGESLSGAAELIRRLASLEERRKAGAMAPVEIPAGAIRSERYMEALDRLSQGERAFSMLSFGNDEAKALLAQTLVSGLPAKEKSEWVAVKARVSYERELTAALAQWSALSDEAGWPDAPSGGLDKRAKAVRASAAAWSLARDLGAVEAKIREGEKAVFGSVGASSLSELAQSLGVAAELARLEGSDASRSRLLNALSGFEGPATDAMKGIASLCLSGAGAGLDQAEEGWREGLARLGRVASLGEAFESAKSALAKIEGSGAAAWARRLASEPVENGVDDLARSDWSAAWEARAWDNQLQELDDPSAMRKMMGSRRDAEARLASAYEDLVVKKTWLGVQRNCTESVRQRLQQYLNSVQAMGKGTGIRAQRHRATARAAMKEAYKAVSCWIMPQWRVSEAMLPELGLFDLVIIDEASQSDIWALPALARGKKVLIVGDHKQVSPSAIGVAEERIAELSSRFLQDQPYKAEMTPDKSIYALASVVFAGSSIMLKEHFRSHPAIIEFSNRNFYNGQIKPLRSPKASHGGGAPLIDVYVPDGFRKGDVNPPEARAIVNEIKEILKDPARRGKTIGVVTLLGHDQAALISKMANEEIEPAQMIERKIAVGAPPVFQGRERDIMMISMVLEEGDRSAADKLEMEQRFNVAMSRARDQAYLFRSARQESFAADSLTGKLIEHFKRPYARDPGQVASLRDLCESDFERAVFDDLAGSGYRVTPQFACGGYRIDFVVEGDGGQRLAVECDGDRYHGPERWSDDMARQRVLERSGWAFWRCFGSAYARKPEEARAQLFAALDEMGVKPVADPLAPPSALVESRVAPAFVAGKAKAP